MRLALIQMMAGGEPRTKT